MWESFTSERRRESGGEQCRDVTVSGDRPLCESYEFTVQMPNLSLKKIILFERSSPITFKAGRSTAPKKQDRVAPSITEL